MLYSGCCVYRDSNSKLILLYRDRKRQFSLATHPYVNLAKGAGGGMLGINLCTYYLGALCAFSPGGSTATWWAEF